MCDTIMNNLLLGTCHPEFCMVCLLMALSVTSRFRAALPISKKLFHPYSLNCDNGPHASGAEGNLIPASSEGCPPSHHVAPLDFVRYGLNSELYFKIINVDYIVYSSGCGGLFPTIEAGDIAVPGKSADFYRNNTGPSDTER